MFKDIFKPKPKEADSSNSKIKAVSVTTSVEDLGTVDVGTPGETVYVVDEKTGKVEKRKHGKMRFLDVKIEREDL